MLGPLNAQMDMKDLRVGLGARGSGGPGVRESGGAGRPARPLDWMGGFIVRAQLSRPETRETERENITRYETDASALEAAEM